MPWGYVSCCALLSCAGFLQGGLAHFLHWPIISASAVLLAYALDRPQLLGKRSDGSFGAFRLTVLFPFILWNESIWKILRYKPDVPYAWLTEKLAIGRRLSIDEYPRQVVAIVDLTSELLASPLPAHCNYHHFPLLDKRGISSDRIRQLVTTIDRYKDGVVYLHCAEGRGRAAFVAAAYLLVNGLARTPEEALHICRAKRPVVHPSSQQLRALMNLSRAMDSSRTVPIQTAILDRQP